MEGEKWSLIRSCSYDTEWGKSMISFRGSRIKKHPCTTDTVWSAGDRRVQLVAWHIWKEWEETCVLISATPLIANAIRGVN